MIARLIRAAAVPALLMSLGFAARASAEFTSLNLGMDYRLRGIAIENNDVNSATKDRLNYYSHDVRVYMTSWLNQDVEGSLRLRALNVWGIEGGTTPFVTPYPSASGTPFVEEAYVHLPNMFWKRVNLILGRQGITLGDGLLVSDNGRGFNAIRAQADLPWGFDADLMTAKIQESLAGYDDFDVHAGFIGWTRDHNRWEIGAVQEQNGATDEYALNGSTVTGNNVMRRFYDVRLHGRLKDAYYKAELAMQDGSVKTPTGEVALEGVAQRLELGAQSDNIKWGRFGVKAVYAHGTGDDPGTPDKDEGFRPTFTRRWDGLQRVGYGQHFAATLSDAYDPANPFSETTNGLPTGYSGIKTMGLGIWSTQGVVWTGSIDYFVYSADKKPIAGGEKDLGAELDLGIVYRYTGFVTFHGGVAYFFPGPAYDPDKAKVTRYTGEVHIHF